MIFEKTNIDGVRIIKPEIMEDDRGGFYRYFCKKEFADIHNKEFVQMNHSINKRKGTLRGLHYQKEPYGEAKLIRCVRGSILDVFVDLRTGSPTFLHWNSQIISDSDHTMIFLPEGIAHGFITLEDNTHVNYHHTEFYNPKAEGGFKYNDPTLSINWEIAPIVISERDKNHPYIGDFKGIEL